MVPSPALSFIPRMGGGRPSLKYWHAMRDRFMDFLDCSLCVVIKREKLSHYSLTAVVSYLNKVAFTITHHH